MIGQRLAPLLWVVPLGASYGFVQHLNGLVAELCGSRFAYPGSFVDMRPSGALGNPNAKYGFKALDDRYDFTYSFQDHKGKKLTWNWQIPKDVVDSDNASFGFPVAMLDPYPGTQTEVARHNKAFNEGGFRLDSVYIRPYYRKIIRDQRDLFTDIIPMARERMGSGDGPEEISTFWLRFCQQFPYGMPPEKFEGRFFGGYLPPSGMLRIGWGDCDCKVGMFGAVMSYMPNQKVIAVMVPGHMLAAVRAVPKPGQTSVRFEGEDYVVCEPVGPATLPFGKPGYSMSTIVWQRRIVPFEDL